MANEFTPTISVDSEGQEYVDYVNGQFQQRAQFHRGLTPQGFEIDEETGEQSVFELEEEVETPEGMMSEYLGAVKEQFPQLPDALEYAKGNLDADLLRHFYSAIDDSDFEDFYAYLDIILAKYEEHLELTGSPEVGDDKSSQQEPTDEEVYEEENQLLDTPDLSGLYEKEPDEELRDTYSELADNSEEGIDKLLYQLSARFYSGTETQDELIEIALASGYSRDELIAAFNRLN